MREGILPQVHSLLNILIATCTDCVYYYR